MALNDLFSEEMLEVSKLWVTPPGTKVNGQEVPSTRPLLESYGLLREMLPFLEKGHQAVLAPIKRSSSSPPELKQISEKQEKLDGRHDPLVRGLFALLPALADLVREPELKAKLVALQQLIIPEGLLRTNFSYRREAGAAQRLEARLTPTQRQQLEKISFTIEDNTYTLLALTEELIEVGKEIGVLEDAKDRLVKAAAPAPEGLNEREAQNLWIQHTTTLVRLVGALGLPAEITEKLLGPLREAERRAVERKASPQPQPAPPPPAETKPAD